MLFSIDILLHRHHRRHLRPSQATKFLFPSFRGRHRASVDGPSPGTRCFCSFSSISAHPSTQGLFCFRIYRLSGNVYTTGLTSLLSTFRVSSGLFLGYHAFRDVPLEPAFMVFQQEWDWLLTTAFAVGALADLTIACTLCYHVNKLASPLVMETYVRGRCGVGD